MTDTPDTPVDATASGAAEADVQPNEIVQASQDARARFDAAAASGSGEERERRWPIAKIGLGVGIGSAAIAAAVLFANRDRGSR